MYDVSLTNLAADAHAAAAAFGRIERPGLTEPEVKILLGSFCAIDPVENAVAAPEIRIKVRSERYLVCLGQKMLLLYDTAHREQPALVLTLEGIMAELNGSAQVARDASTRQHEVAAREAVVQSSLPAPGAASRPRLIALGAAALVLLGAITYLQFGSRDVRLPATFHALQAAEVAELQPALIGVYLTGNQPGQHGIAFLTAGEFKLIELTALTAPRVVRASGQLGRVGSQLVLATDQPGGLVEISGHGTLVYCGEVYRRVP